MWKDKKQCKKNKCITESSFLKKIATRSILIIDIVRRLLQYYNQSKIVIKQRRKAGWWKKIKLRRKYFFIKKKNIYSDIASDVFEHYKNKSNNKATFTVKFTVNSIITVMYISKNWKKILRRKQIVWILFFKKIKYALKKVKAVVDIIILYNKKMKKLIWNYAFLYSAFAFRYKNNKSLKHKKSINWRFSTRYILRRKPDLILNSPKEFKYFFDSMYMNKIVRELYNTKVIVVQRSRIFKKLVSKKQRIASNWIFKRYQNRKIRRKFMISLSQSWGNYGNLDKFKFKKQRLYYSKETLIVAGRNFFKKKKNLYVFNKLKYDRRVFFPLPVVKKEKRYQNESIFIKWLVLGFFVLERSHFINNKKTRLVVSSNNGQILLKKIRKIGHPFHLVNPSILPIAFCYAMLLVITNFILFFWSSQWYFDTHAPYLHISAFGLFFSLILSWIMEVFSEEQSGAHSLEVQKGFQYAILLFILSELMLFVSFFWAYFHFNLNSNSFTGGTFTPIGLVPFLWFRIPLLNTLLLLTSGLSLTIAHVLMTEADKIGKLFIWLTILGNVKSLRWINWFHSLYTLENSHKSVLYASKKSKHFSKLQFFASRFLNTSKKTFIKKTTLFRAYNHLHKVGRIAFDSQINIPRSFVVNFKDTPKNSTWQVNFWLLDTVVKGVVFLIYQTYEYTSCMFSINDSVYGAVFFSLTGLHGLHVFIGVFFLFITLIINLKKNMGRVYSRYFSWRSRVFLYFDKGALPKNSFKLKIWTHRIGFDGAAWYWHFVDVVWFFVFVFVYWWGYTIV